VMARRSFRVRLADTLLRWAHALKPAPEPQPISAEPAAARPRKRAAMSQMPGLRAPLSIDKAVRSRDLNVLKREASDALAALGAAHAVVSSARLAQIQTMRPEVDRGDVEQDVLIELAGDYQAWQNDQVRLFDALALVLGITVPEGRAFDQIDEDMEAAAGEHLNALAAEYQRRLLTDQFEAGPKEG